MGTASLETGNGRIAQLLLRMLPHGVASRCAYSLSTGEAPLIRTRTLSKIYPEEFSLNLRMFSRMDCKNYNGQLTIPLDGQWAMGHSQRV